MRVPGPRLGSKDAEGNVLVMRALMTDGSVRLGYRAPSNARPLCRPSNGHGQHWSEWADAIRRAK